MARGGGLGLAGGLASGLESGVGLGLRLRDQGLQEEETARRTRRQDERDTWDREDRTRKLADDEDERAIKAINEQYEGLRTEGEGYVAQYGRNVPEEIGADFSRRQREVGGARDSLLRKRYEPILKKAEQQRDEMVSRFKAGQLDPNSVPDKDLHDFVVASTRRDPRDFLSTDGKPSRVHQATTDVMTGLETGNEQMMLSGANILLEPELKIGVGETSPHGGKIVGKEIIKMIPDPNKDGAFMPVVRVYVKQGGKQAGPNLENGATGYYDAPITENRSSDPDDIVKSIDIKKAMDYAAQAQTFSTLLDKPELRAKIERGVKESEKAPSNFMQAFYAVKGKMPAKAVTTDKIDLGDRVRVTETDASTGERKTTEIPKGAAPRSGGLGGQIAAIEEYAAANGMEFEEAAKLMQANGLLRAPGKGGRGGGGGGGGGDGGGLGGGAGLEGLSGEDFLAKLKPDEQRIVKGLADGSIKPDDIATKGNRREHMLSLAKQYEAAANLTGRAKTVDKPMPDKARGELTEARSNAATLGSLQAGFKDDYASKGVLGIGADLSLGAKATLGTDKEAVNWWKNYRKMAELVERHSMFGASLTTGEQTAWRSADISPGMDKDVIRENLDTRKKLADKVLEATQADMIDAGYGEERVRKIGGRDVTVPLDSASRAAAAGAPTKLPSDKAAAAAAYKALPSGATFIDPNGVTRRKP